MLMAINLLVYLWTEFKSLGRSLFLFIFLGSIPAVFNNNMWWHPESLVTLFVVSTIFSLSKDKLRYGRWFYLAAVFCGLATGTKVIGLRFFLSVAVYLALGLRKVEFNTLLKHGSVFFLVMVFTIIFTNPLLLIPREARAIFATLARQASMNAFGWGVQMTKGPLPWYVESLRAHFDFWWTYIMVLGACVWGIIHDREKRVLNIIILTWVLSPSLYLLFFVANKAWRYFLPAFLPLRSCVGNQVMWDFKDRYRHSQIAAFALASMSILLSGLQIEYYTQANIGSCMYTLRREQESSSIEFYLQLDETYISKLPQDVRSTVFRDPHVYSPPLENLDVNMKWGSADYGDIESINPDLILLQKSYIEKYAYPAVKYQLRSRASAKKL